MLPLFHLVVIAVNSFTIWYDQKYVDFPFRKELLVLDLPFKRRLLLLTMWCLALQTLYFIVALLNDIVGSNERSPKRAPFIRKIKDTLFSLAFPVALYVSLAFWAIYAIDSELIVPEVIAKAVPAWGNHVLHTTIVIFIVIELLYAPRTYPSRKVTMSLTFIFIFSYLIYLHINHLKCGIWIYPVLDVLPWHLRTMFFVLSTLIGVFMSIVGQKLDSIVNPKKDNVKQKKR